MKLFFVCWKLDLHSKSKIDCYKNHICFQQGSFGLFCLEVRQYKRLFTTKIHWLHYYLLYFKGILLIVSKCVKNEL